MRAAAAGVLELLVLVDDLDAVVILLGGGIVADGSEVSVHDDRGCRVRAADLGTRRGGVGAIGNLQSR